MSYDLLVFDAASKPKDLESLFAWLGEEQASQVSFDDLSIATPALQAWVSDIHAAWLAQQGSVLAVGGLLLGHYLAYAWGLRWRLRRA